MLVYARWLRLTTRKTALSKALDFYGRATTARLEQ